MTGAQVSFLVSICLATKKDVGYNLRSLGLRLQRHLVLDRVLGPLGEELFCFVLGSVNLQFKRFLCDCAAFQKLVQLDQP